MDSESYCEIIIPLTENGLSERPWLSLMLDHAGVTGKEHFSDNVACILTRPKSDRNSVEYLKDFIQYEIRIWVM